MSKRKAPPTSTRRSRSAALPADLCVEAVKSCLCFNLRALTRNVKTVYDTALRAAGLNSGQFALLLTLQIAGPSTMRNLAAAAHTDRTTLNRNLTPLIKRGLVAERPDKDQRVRRVALTAKGSKAIRSALPSWKKAQRQTAGLLTANGMNRLLGVVHDSLATIHTNGARKK